MFGDTYFWYSWCFVCIDVICVLKWKIERVCNYSRRISRWRCNPVVKQKRKVNSEIKDSFSDRKHLYDQVTLDQNMNTFTYLYHCIAIPNSRHLTSVSIFSEMSGSHISYVSLKLLFSFVFFLFDPFTDADKHTRRTTKTTQSSGSTV